MRVTDSSHGRELFDDEVGNFSYNLRFAADWKQNFFGAAHETRVLLGIQHARNACDELERFLIEAGRIQAMTRPLRSNIKRVQQRNETDERPTETEAHRR